MTKMVYDVFELEYTNTEGVFLATILTGPPPKETYNPDTDETEIQFPLAADKSIETYCYGVEDFYGLSGSTSLSLNAKKALHEEVLYTKPGHWGPDYRTEWFPNTPVRILKRETDAGIYHLQLGGISLPLTERALEPVRLPFSMADTVYRLRLRLTVHTCVFKPEADLYVVDGKIAFADSGDPVGDLFPVSFSFDSTDSSCIAVFCKAVGGF